VAKKQKRYGRHLESLLIATNPSEKYGILNVAGAAVGRAAAVWPYRLWTGVWEHLLQTYPDRLTVETFTPALSINRVKSMDGEPLYRISTPKCDIQASKVVYCSNGFTGHLLPALQGKIFPWRGTMSCQDLGPSFPNVGAERSWSFISESKIDPELGVPNAGLYYLTQNGKTGHMFLGGENEALENILTSDDSQLNPNSAKKIGKVLPTLFKDAKDPPKVEKIWSGIMGFTKDGLPLVGPLPEFVTGRPTHDGEYIAAGFNGYGTGYCFLCGKAVGEMILGKNTDWMPAVFLVTEERFEGGLVSSRFHGHLLP
jgi:glycine/D-amino acid oxidase-like deaminating enzyme